MKNKYYLSKLKWVLYPAIASIFAGISLVTDWFDRLSLDRFFALQGTFMGVGISLAVAWSVWQYIIREIVKTHKK